MGGFIKTLKNIWSIADLRQRILYTLGLIMIFRAGTYVVLPGLDPEAWNQAMGSGPGGLLGLFDIFAGGAFGRASIFSLGIMPYISASIVMQLLTMVYPPIQKLQREGESGRRKVNQYTRYLTILVTGFQAVAYSGYVRSQVGGRSNFSPFSYILVKLYGYPYCRNPIRYVVGRKNYGQWNWKRYIPIDYRRYHCHLAIFIYCRAGIENGSGANW